MQFYLFKNLKLLTEKCSKVIREIEITSINVNASFYGI